MRVNFLGRKLIILVVLSVICSSHSAPTGTEEKSEDPCEIEDLQTCDENDETCDTKNVEIKEKREKVCLDNPQCQFCNATEQVEAIPLDEEDPVIVEPEIVPTLSPPLETESVPVNETIIIDADVSTVTEDPQKTENDKEEKAPAKLVERNIVIENDKEKQYYRGYVDPSSNITTIIRLTNLINNTNVINMPTTLNNTNINNIHVYSNKSAVSGGKYGLGYTEDGPCCYSMKPGSCKKTTAGLKCRHKKTKVCGKQCSKKMIHSSRSACNHIPQWPYMICPHQQMPLYPPSYFEDDNSDDDDEVPLFPEDDELENPDSGWIVMQEKCKIVSEDGLHITNCTNSEFEHPYARNSIDEHSKRAVRHAGKAQMPQFQQQMQMPSYGYMMPVYFQPVVPIMMPQYFAQQPMMSNYPQQLPFPPLEAEQQYYEEPIIQTKAVNPYRKSKKHAKKHPIVVEHDEEL